MTTLRPRSVLALLALAFAACGCSTTQPAHDQQKSKEHAMLIQYLEIVTPDLNATCNALEQLHGVTFSEPVPGLGNARTAEMKDGGRIGVRAPMRADEGPVVRPYLLVEDIEAAVEAGAMNVESDENVHVITCEDTDFAVVREALVAKYDEPEKSGLIWMPNVSSEVDENVASSILKLIDALEDNDDVQNVYTNFEASDEVMEKLIAVG